MTLIEIRSTNWEDSGHHTIISADGSFTKKEIYEGKERSTITGKLTLAHLTELTKLFTQLDWNSLKEFTATGVDHTVITFTNGGKKQVADVNPQKLASSRTAAAVALAGIMARIGELTESARHYDTRHYL